MGKEKSAITIFLFFVKFDFKFEERVQSTVLNKEFTQQMRLRLTSHLESIIKLIYIPVTSKSIQCKTCTDILAR